MLKIVIIKGIRGALRAAIAATFIAAANGTLRAQVVNPITAQQEPIPGVDHAYIGLGTEMVNPADGSLSFNLPIQTVPGRQLSFPFSIRFNSAEPFYINQTNFTGTLQWTTPILNKTPAPFNVNGWSYALPNYQAEAYVSSSSPVSGGCGNPAGNPCPGGNTNFCWSTRNYTFQGFDGLLLPLSIVNSWPWVNNPTPNACFQTPYPSGGTGANGLIESFGTPPAGSVGIQPPLTVTDKSGTVYQFPTGPGISTSPTVVAGGLTPFAALAQSVTDRNGNQIKLNGTIVSLSGSPLPAGSYKDTAGRTVVAWSGLGNSSGDQLTFSGLTDGVSVKWTTTTVTLPETVDQTIGYGCTFGGSPMPMSVVSEIVLPNGKAYTFDYQDGSGLVDKITFPDGGYVRYVWGIDPAGTSFTQSWVDGGVGRFCAVTLDAPAITDRYVSLDGSTEVLHQHFDFASNPTQWSNNGSNWYWTAKNTTVTTSELVGTNWVNTAVTRYAYVNSAAPNQGNGVALEKSIVYQSGSGSTLQTVNKSWRDPYTPIGSQTILDNGQGITTLNCPDIWGDVTDTYVYGFQSQGSKPGDPTCAGISPSTLSAGMNTAAMGPLMRHTRVVYHVFSNTHIINEPNSVTVLDGSGNQASQTAYQYDQSSVASSDAINLVAPPGARGNATSASRWLNSTGASLTTTYTYFDTGQIQSKTEPCGSSSCNDVQGGVLQKTQYSYTDNPANGGNSNAYLTQIKQPNTGVAHNRSYQYDYTFGLPIQATDENNNVTTYEYDDPLRRLTDVYDPMSATNGQIPHTHYDYLDGIGANITTTDPVGVKSKVVYDGMDHPVQSIKLTDPQGADTVKTTYDGNGLALSVSSPKRTYPSTNTDDVTSYAYDALGRKTLQTDQSDLSTESWTYSGNTVTFTDEANHQWIRTNDALGRLIQVVEPATMTGVVPKTSYTYDGLDNLINVNQNGGTDGQRSRTFTYDSLSRLVCAANPESSTTSCPASAIGTMPSGTLRYVYDANGNVSSRTDARGAITEYEYDALNRVTSKTYPSVQTVSPAPPIAPTASVNYIYDVAMGGWGWVPQSSPSWPSVSQTNLIGRLSDVSVGAPGANAWTVYGYDEMGRTILKSECLPMLCGTGHYDMHYKYDLAGRMSFYDRGLDAVRNHVFPNSGYYFGGFAMQYDGANNLSAVIGDSGDNNTATNIWNNTDYFPTGQVYTALALGRYNLKYSVSPRGWVTGQVITNTATQSIWNSSASYNTNGTVSATTDRYAGAWSYVYDSLNRLWKASGPGGATTYSIDAFGNKFQQTTTSGLATSPNYGIAPTNALSGNGLQYDLVTSAGYYTGNVFKDGSGNSFFYDAEGRLYSMNNTICYTYDGEGDRVAKTNCNLGSDGQGHPTGILSQYLYDIDHRLTTEVNVSTALMNRANIYAGSTYLAEDAPDAYLTNTPTASLLRITDSVGTLRARWDLGSNWDGACTSFPYGDAMTCNVPPLSTALFAGKDRDSETALDYFGARYYDSTMGRFMSPDPSRLSIMPSNPQTWNRYAYVYNNPLGLKDDNGRWPTKIHNQIIDKAFPNLTQAQRQILKNVSADQDSILLGGQSNDLAFQHGMRGPDQTVDQAQGQYNEFVSGEETAAQNAQLQFWMADPDNKLDNLSDESLEAFGAALHAIEDSLSPAHAGFQVWNVWNLAADWRHHNAEKTISPAQMQAAVNAARNAYNVTYGYLIGPMQDNTSVTTSQGPGVACGAKTGTPCE